MSEHPIPAHWMALYHDGELSAAQRAQLETHLAACEWCQRELVALEALSSLLAVDRLQDDALVGQSALWNELAGQLPERTRPTASVLKWLPGIGLLLANGVVQFLAALSLGVMLFGPLLGQGAWNERLGQWVMSWWIGWPARFVPAAWTSWGVALVYVAASAVLAVFYLAWLGLLWRYRQQPIAARVEWSG